MNKSEFIEYIRTIDKDMAKWVSHLPIIESMPDVKSPLVYCVNCWRWDSPAWVDLYYKLEERFG